MNSYIFLILSVLAIHRIYGEELTEEEKKKAFDAMYTASQDAYSGDMMLTTKQRAGMKNRVAVNNLAARWTNNTVLYWIDPSLSKIAPMITNAAQHIEWATGGCVKVRPTKGGERNYIRVFHGNGCNSAVGMTNRGVQDLSLGDGCHVVGTIIHEFLHAIGFDHEQNRPDRDDYLYIYWDNIQDNLKFAFNKVTNGLTWTSFDFDSIMLYGNNAFAKDYSKPTMVDKTGKRPLKHPYERNQMTAWDVLEVKKFYGCPT